MPPGQDGGVEAGSINTFHFYRLLEQEKAGKVEADFLQSGINPHGGISTARSGVWYGLISVRLGVSFKGQGQETGESMNQNRAGGFEIREISATRTSRLAARTAQRLHQEQRWTVAVNLQARRFTIERFCPVIRLCLRSDRARMPYPGRTWVDNPFHSPYG